jgi:hypothetical protein
VLRDESHTTVSENRRAWLDTPFSLFAIQCGCLFASLFVFFSRLFVQVKEFRADALGLFSAFQAPEEPSGMQALLAHSVQTYGPLPSNLHPRRRV